MRVSNEVLAGALQCGERRQVEHNEAGGEQRGGDEDDLARHLVARGRIHPPGERVRTRWHGGADRHLPDVRRQTGGKPVLTIPFGGVSNVFEPPAVDGKSVFSIHTTGTIDAHRDVSVAL